MTLEPHPDPASDRFPALQRFAAELHALGVDCLFYLGILMLLVVGAITLWEQLPDAVAQAREVAISAGWMVDTPPLRGSL